MAILKDLIVSGQSKLLGTLNVTGTITGNLTGTATKAKDSEKLGGYPVASLETTASVTGIPVIATNYSMEIGQYLDFHNKGTSVDYSNRIESGGTGFVFRSSGTTTNIATLIGNFATFNRRALLTENDASGVVKLTSSDGTSASELDCNGNLLRLIHRTNDGPVLPLYYNRSTDKTFVRNAVNASGVDYFTKSGGTLTGDLGLNEHRVIYYHTVSDSFIQNQSLYIDDMLVGSDYFRMMTNKSQVDRFLRVFYPTAAAGDTTNRYSDLRISVSKTDAHWNFVNTGIPSLHVSIGGNRVFNEGYKPYVYGTTNKQTNTLGFKPSFLIIATGAQTTSCTAASNGFVSITSTGFQFASAPTTTYGYIAFR